MNNYFYYNINNIKTIIIIIITLTITITATKTTAAKTTTPTTINNCKKIIITINILLCLYISTAKLV